MSVRIGTRSDSNQRRTSKRQKALGEAVQEKKKKKEKINDKALE